MYKDYLSLCMSQGIELSRGCFIHFRAPYRNIRLYQYLHTGIPELTQCIRMTSSLSWKFEISELDEAFHDVVPVDVMEEEEYIDNDTRISVVPVTSIDYTEAFRIAYGYFRAIFRSQEFSWRTLKLTATCLHLNPANYTVWHFRRHCLRALHHPVNVNAEANTSESWSYVKDDLDMAASLGGENPKNYQIWYHRRAMLDQLPPAEFLKLAKDLELEYVNAVLRVDAKNYHAWSHRQWVISIMVESASAESTSNFNGDDSEIDPRKHFVICLWNAELIWVEQVLEEDIRNNSAWNYRWYIAHSRNKAEPVGKTSNSSGLSVSEATTEMDYALQIIAMDPYNESPWKYFSALLKEQFCNLTDELALHSLLSESERRVAEIENNHLIVSEKIDVSNRDDSEILDIACESRQPSTYLLGALVDILEWKGNAESLGKAIELMETLATQHDAIRKKYWKYRINRVEVRLQKFLKK
jgi:protein farnesyltransferase/geranylgeranyltransferase type-1 subunit alpha